MIITSSNFRYDSDILPPKSLEEATPVQTEAKPLPFVLYRMSEATEAEENMFKTLCGIVEQRQAKHSEL